MEKLQFSILINAPKEKVYKVMLTKETYLQWTEAFNPGPDSSTSSFEGDWSEGSKMRFLGTDEKGVTSGMLSRVEKNIPNEFVSLEHLGEIVNGVEDTTSKRAKSWAGAHENYTFKEKDGVTELVVEIDMKDEYKEMFEEMWPKALEKLKEICEA
jgi:uncharacterized protein YndB with AHSA1/START domain